MSENWRQSEIRIVINDKSQDSIGKHLSWTGYFTTNLFNMRNVICWRRLTGLFPSDTPGCDRRAATVVDGVD